MAGRAVPRVVEEVLEAEWKWFLGREPDVVLIIVIAVVLYDGTILFLAPSLISS